ncbi:hypothetical protein WMY93_025977 [Mugilogobius chulae]|uniref:Uncharacterized protein n=1 Tax=Mugilogobius chulae TaxID=88201 RepID=A0AAW0N0X5_9GOBI
MGKKYKQAYFLVESTQSMIRILGLSATLPNYLDVATFLHVNPYIGLFFFDGRFRPVPLGQTFVGIKTTNKVQQLHDMEEVVTTKYWTKSEQDIRKSCKSVSELCQTLREPNATAIDPQHLFWAHKHSESWCVVELRSHFYNFSV